MVPCVIFVVALFALNDLTPCATTTPGNYNSTETTEVLSTTEMSTEATTMSTGATTMSTGATTMSTEATTMSTGATTVSTGVPTMSTEDTTMSITTTLPPIPSTQSFTTTKAPSSATITATPILTTQSSLSPTLPTSSSTLTPPSPMPTSITFSETSSVTVTSESPSTTAELTSPLTSTVTFRYPVFTSQNGHNCSHFEYVFDSSTKLCTHKCETIHCENKGVCVLTVGTNGVTTAGCGCDTTGDTVYSGGRCEKSEISRQKERGITLGILIPIIAILLLFLVCVCTKMKRYGSTESRFRNNYNVNAGNL